MMLTTLILAAGLLAPASEPQPEPQKGWVAELRGYTYHRQAKPEGWIFELRGLHKHGEQPETPQAKIEPVETFRFDDLPAFFKELKKR